MSVYDYVCDFHPSMTSTISCVKDTSSWQGDFRAFADNLIIPRVIEDPADSTDKWMISIPDQTRYSTFDTVMSQFNNYNLTAIICQKYWKILLILFTSILELLLEGHIDNSRIVHLYRSLQYTELKTKLIRYFKMF